MTIESEFQKVGSVGYGASRDVFKCRKCFCLVARNDRKDHRDKMHPVKARVILKK